MCPKPSWGLDMCIPIPVWGYGHNVNYTLLGLDMCVPVPCSGCVQNPVGDLDTVYSYTLLGLHESLYTTLVVGMAIYMIYVYLYFVGLWKCVPTT